MVCTRCISCDDPVWCNIEMPKSSYFGFSPPLDAERWKQSQAIAASGRQIFAERIRKIFTHPFDYLDGDKAFRNIENMVDLFIDPKTMFGPITGGYVSTESKKRYARQINRDGKTDEMYIRKSYQSRYMRRAPIIQIGSFRYNNAGRIVSVGGNAVRSVSRSEFLAEFAAAEEHITTPAIYVCALNENWGWMSSAFPNRTMQWGRYPKPRQVPSLLRFLDSDKTLMMVINQQTNFSHPKLLTLPRGIPLQWEHTPKIVFDSLEYVIRQETKELLLVSMSSSWGPRPQILRCISEKFSPSDFYGHTAGAGDKFATDLLSSSHTESRMAYYIKLARARFGLMLPGMGYDCFRNWEILLMGSVGVVERGVGFDRMFWRLPVLLVDDFYDITPDLLRSAYIEAIYRVDDFEYERLKQSYWYSVIHNVSTSRSVTPMLEKFPMRAEKQSFVRPLVPFYCGDDNEYCGEPRIRTPKHSC